MRRYRLPLAIAVVALSVGVIVYRTARSYLPEPAPTVVSTAAPLMRKMGARTLADLVRYHDGIRPSGPARGVPALSRVSDPPAPGEGGEEQAHIGKAGSPHDLLVLRGAEHCEIFGDRGAGRIGLFGVDA
jgi:hypothetical protein